MQSNKKLEGERMKPKKEERLNKDLPKLVIEKVRWGGLSEGVIEEEK